jgi:hypothetical protein
MADFFVQNDGGTIDNANAYVTVAEFKAYHKARDNDFDGGGGEIEKAIVTATDYLDDRWEFVGVRLTRDQATEWPRRDAEDSQGYVWTGVPTKVKEACSEYALIALSGDLDPTPERDVSGRTVSSKREKVGPIEESKSFSGSALYSPPEYPVADRKLAGLTTASGYADRG